MLIPPKAIESAEGNDQQVLFLGKNSILNFRYYPNLKIYKC
jgi:hypothetical protein